MTEETKAKLREIARQAVTKRWETDKGFKIGQRFHRLCIISKGNGRVSPSGAKQRTWICLCDCGNKVEVPTASLNYGHTTSCGCRKRELNAIAMRKVALRHGHAVHGNVSRTYKTWRAMLGRCYYPNDNGYEWAGALGVYVCNRWFTFENFLSDMGERPNGKSIDRINPFGNYEPENCRWATPLEQRHNRRSTYCAKS